VGAEIMSKTIFYSWQNDLEPKYHRYFVEKCLKDALNSLGKNAQIYVDYDRDTKGLLGSPDITSSIFDKIDKSVLFVCDVSIINKDIRKTPNPNVLLELGYAASKLGWDKIISLFDSESGSVNDLPFDLRQKRITLFNAKNKDEKKRLTNILSENIKALFVKGALFNPLNDYMKRRIDKAYLDIAKGLANFLYGTTSMSTGLANVSKFLNLNNKQVLEIIKERKIPAFVVYNTYEQTSVELRDILKEVLSSQYFAKKWSYYILELIEWINHYSYMVSKRNKDFPFEEIAHEESIRYGVIDAHKMNNANPLGSKIIVELFDDNSKKYIEDGNGGKVINITQYPIDDDEKLTKTVKVNEKHNVYVANIVCDFIKNCAGWLDDTDSEFILDPDFYVLESPINNITDK
jgi:hypothetical protein